MPWLKKAEVCVVCSKRKTRREFEGHAVCPDCLLNVRAQREGIRHCPVDGSAMQKQKVKVLLRETFIIDVCLVCNGVWLDNGELEAIKEQAMATGVGTGSAMASFHHHPG